jgi:hypothetical protein
MVNHAELPVSNSGVLERCEITWPAEPPWWLEIQLPDGERLRVEAGDLFDALLELRRRLEADGRMLVCQGALPDVWPSGMSSQMSGGRIAYRLGGDGRGLERVDVFDPADPDEVVCVADQLEGVASRRGRFDQEIAGRAARSISPELVEEAKRNPGGWVYEIEGDFGPAEAIPSNAIRGAWKVDDGGRIVGDLVPNPNFRPERVRDSD